MGATESHSRMYLATRRLHRPKGTSHRRLLLPGNARNFCGAGLTPAGHLWYCSLPQSKFICFCNMEIRPPPHEKQQTKIPYTVHWCPDKRQIHTYKQNIILSRQVKTKVFFRVSSPLIADFLTTEPCSGHTLGSLHKPSSNLCCSK